ncbi:MAG: hypothetical protein V7607_4811 [Solirubrobacteraceae bacterium]
MLAAGAGAVLIGLAIAIPRDAEQSGLFVRSRVVTVAPLQRTPAIGAFDRRQPSPGSSPAELEREVVELRAIARRQQLAIEALTSVVSALRRSAAALTEENKELRAQIAGKRRNGV